MSLEEKYRNKRWGAYALIIIAAAVFTVGCVFLHHFIMTLIGLFGLMWGLVRKVKIDRKYREEVSAITETPEIDFKLMDELKTKGRDASQ